MKIEKKRNQYLYRASLAVNRLQKIYDKEIEYMPDDYALLISTFERYYKGVCVKLHELYPDNPDFQMDEGEYCSTHRFTDFIRKINKVMPVSKYQEGVECILDRADLIGNRYTKARFSHEFSFVEFQKDFSRLKRQMERLNGMIETKEMENNLDKEEDYWR